jgi:hypothetical protein
LVVRGSKQVHMRQHPFDSSNWGKYHPITQSRTFNMNVGKYSM